jgi:hypothetical protein
MTPPDAIAGRRLDLLALQVRQQLLADPAGLPLLLAYARGPPLRSLVRDRALPEPEVLPDIGPVCLDRPAVTLIEPEVGRRNVYQPRDLADGLVRNLAAA